MVEMKGIILIIAFFVLLIGTPILPEANDITKAKLPNHAFQNEKVKLAWYKNMNYTFGYNGGLCLGGKDLSYYPYDVIGNIVGKFYWLNSIETGVRIPIESRIIDVGFSYALANTLGGAHLRTDFDITSINGKLVNCAYLGVGQIRKVYLYLSYSDSESNNVILGSELNYCPAYGTEYYYYGTSGVFNITDIRRDLIGGGVYLKFCNTKNSKKRFRFDPYFMIKITGSHEVYSTSPYRGLWKNKLTVWYTGIYGGFNLNIKGKNKTNYFHNFIPSNNHNGRTNDSTEKNFPNPALQKQNINMPWYKNVDYTIGYNVGLCLRGEDFYSYPYGGVDVVSNIIGRFYWLNSIEAGVRIPIKNRIIETGLGYGWANMTFTDLAIKNIYTYISYSIIRYCFIGLKLDYFSLNGTDHDFIGYGGYIKLNSTITLNSRYRINPYIMFKIGKAYKINNTSLTLLYTGIYGGFNFNIGGRR